MKKVYIKPEIEIVATQLDNSILAHSGYHDHGHNGDRGNPDKGGWKSKEASSFWEDDDDDIEIEIEF